MQTIWGGVMIIEQIIQGWQQFFCPEFWRFVGWSMWGKINKWEFIFIWFVLNVKL